MQVMSHHADLLGRAAYYLQKALDSKSIRQAADMLELAYFFKRMAYDVRALEMARWPSSPASSPQPMRRRHLDESIARWWQRSWRATARPVSGAGV
jgi:hypothetical protein